MASLTTWDAILSSGVEVAQNWWNPIADSMRAFLPSSIFAVALLTTDTNASYHDGAGVLQYVNPKVGTLGYSPNGNGGMIPSVCPPFGMTRWTAQTRENFISQVPYSDGDAYLHGFQSTHQPAIWMGESGHFILSPGWGTVQPLFEKRAHKINKTSETSTPYVYEVTFDAKTSQHGANLTESIYSPVPGGAQKVPDDVQEGANGRTRRALPEYATPTLLPRASTEEQEEDITDLQFKQIKVNIVLCVYLLSKADRC
jgi:putative alpha-1,2-mannosidase